jgi:hypothetical protein
MHALTHAFSSALFLYCLCWAHWVHGTPPVPWNAVQSSLCIYIFFLQQGEVLLSPYIDTSLVSPCRCHPLSSAQMPFSTLKTSLSPLYSAQNFPAGLWLKSPLHMHTLYSAELWPPTPSHHDSLAPDTCLSWPHLMTLGLNCSGGEGLGKGKESFWILLVNLPFSTRIPISHLMQWKCVFMVLMRTLCARHCAGWV